jgi:hypothetical protein
MSEEADVPALSSPLREALAQFCSSEYEIHGDRGAGAALTMAMGLRFRARTAYLFSCSSPAPSVPSPSTRFLDQSSS